MTEVEKARLDRMRTALGNALVLLTELDDKHPFSLTVEDREVISDVKYAFFATEPVR